MIGMRSFGRSDPRLASQATRGLLVAMLVAATALAAGAQPTQSFVESGFSSHHLTGDLGSMQRIFIRGVMQTDPRNVWTPEAVDAREFGDRGVAFGLMNTHSYGDRWYVSSWIGGGSGAFFLPRYRAGLRVARKWGALSRVVTTAGAGYHAWRDEHRDAQLSAGVIYYFGTPLVAEAEVSWNRSSPGGIVSRYQYLALTQGRDRDRYLTARLASGREAYQLIGPESAIADFPSTSFGLGIRQWITQRGGITGSAELYHNPTYTRQGVTISAFYHFE